MAILQKGLLNQVGTLEELSAAEGSRIVVRGLPAGVIEALSATSARLTLEGGKAVIECGDERVRREVEQLLRDRGVDIKRVETERESLEEIFFGAIDREEAS